jgi:protocatechuate 3,4-dioxygenase beta subunit
MDPIPYRRETPGTQPPALWPDYRSTVMRSPRKPLIALPHTLSEVTGPIFGHDRLQQNDADLTAQHKERPIGDRMIVAGRVIDENGRPVAGTLVEIWQANSAGRYFHPRDSRDAPLDPNFTGGGRTITDEEGRYRFITIKPGYYPWGNHPNAWRPAHIHFSVFGPSFVTRLICQMYFEDDPMLRYDPIYMSVPSEAGRKQLLAKFDYELTVPGFGLGYRFDIVLRGRDATPSEADDHAH